MTYETGGGSVTAPGVGQEDTGNPYDSGGQQLVTLRCSGGGGACGADSKSVAAGGTPLTGDMVGIAVPRDNSLGADGKPLKIGDKGNVQVGDKTIENVPVTDYTKTGSNNYVASGGLEKELGGTGRDAALITPSAQEVLLPTPRPQDIDSNGNPVFRSESSFSQEPDLSVADLSYLNQFEPNDLLLSNEQIAENIANDQAARSFGEETGGGGELSQTVGAADNAPVKEAIAATAIGEGETIPLPQSRPDISGARVQEAVGDAHSALQDVRDSTDQLERVLKNPNSTLSSFKSAGNDVLESLKDSRPVLQEAKQAALDAGDKKLADKIQTSINQVNTSIARINVARNQVQNGINEVLNDPARGWVGRAYIENVAMERLRSNPKLEAGLANLRGIWVRR